MQPEGAGRVAAFVNGKAEEDAAVAGDDDAVGVAELQGGGRTEEVVAGFVEMLALALAKARQWRLPLGGGDQGGAG